MEKREQAICQGFVDYMTGEMSDVDRKRFERHLETCASCREDAAEWRHVWDRLAEEAPPQEPPAEWKQEIMQAIFAQSHSEPLKREDRIGKPLRRLAMTAALAIVFLAGFGSRGLLTEGQKSVTADPTVPSRIEKLVTLAPAQNNDGQSAGKTAYGVACLIRSDDGLRLVVYTFGARRTSGNWVYQVWLWNGGKRTSAGTFTVDSSGIGLLTVPWKEDAPMFDSLGITLEPDTHSSQPRGQKIFASL